MITRSIGQPIFNSFGIIATSRETVKSETIKIYEDKIQNLEIEIEDLQSYIRGVEEL